MSEQLLHEDRRVGDSTQEDIRNLILNVVDFKDKAMLLVLLQIAADLAKNTELTEKVGTKQVAQEVTLTKHQTDEKVIMAWVAGAWWVLAGVMVIFGFWFNGTVNEYRNLSATVATHTVALSAIPGIIKDIDALQDQAKRQEGLMRSTK